MAKPKPKQEPKVPRKTRSSQVRKPKGKPKGKEPAPQRVYKFSKATRARMSAAHTGKKLSQETKDKISAAMQERKALVAMGLLPQFRHTDATKARLRRKAKERKAKPGKKALRNSIATRSTRSKDKRAERLARKVLRGES